MSQPLGGAQDSLHTQEHCHRCYYYPPPPPHDFPDKGNISGQPLREVRSPAGEAPMGGGKVGSDVPFLQAGPQ